MEKSVDKKETQKKKKKPFTPPPPEDDKKKGPKKEKNREQRPFMQVDKNGDLLSNFFSNFMKQLKNPTSTGLGKLLASLWGRKSKARQREKELARPSDIIGPAKTVFRHINNSQGTAKTATQNKQLNKRISQSNTTTVKAVQSKPQEITKTRKPRLGM